MAPNIETFSLSANIIQIKYLVHLPSIPAVFSPSVLYQPANAMDVKLIVPLLLVS